MMKINDSEEYYRKLLLLDKVKPCLLNHQKQYIFDLGYCWDILSNHENISKMSFEYAMFKAEKRVKELEKFIKLSAMESYLYSKHILNDRFPEAEQIILTSQWKDEYLELLKKIGKLHELRI